ncbi:hypothetical protein WICPIJ_002071, partial [Wickerhamomyces pijperi]
KSQAGLLKSEGKNQVTRSQSEVGNYKTRYNKCKLKYWFYETAFVLRTIEVGQPEEKPVSTRFVELNIETIQNPNQFRK